MYNIYANRQLFCASYAEDLAVLNPVINLEVNKAGTFSFMVPPTHPYYDRIERKTTLIDVYRDEEKEPLFEGVCVATEVDFYKQKTITCEGELTFLNDSTLRPAYRQALTSRQLLEAYINEHNALTEEMKHFAVGMVTAKDSNDSITCYTNYNSTMTEIKEDLVDDIGGFLRVRHVDGVRYLDYLKDSPHTNNQIIRLGENLLDLVQTKDSDELATVVIPLGATQDEQTIQGLDTRLTITTAEADEMHPQGTDYVYSAQAVEAYGWIEKVVTWDNVTVVSDLLRKGEEYLQDTQFEKLIITASAIDLGLTTDEFNKFRLLDMIRVKSDPHGLDRYFMLTKMTINLNNPENDSITLGIEETAKTLSAKTHKIDRQTEKEIQETSGVLRAAIDNATQLITGAKGGYVVFGFNEQGQPTEIKIQDALENPTKLWRWNINGLGYSNDGGQNYGLAMTMDGAIVADFITAGTMLADRIKGGTFEVGGNGFARNGVILIKDANNVVVARINNTGLHVYGPDGTVVNLGASGLTLVEPISGSDAYRLVVSLDEDGLYCSRGSLYGTSVYQEQEQGNGKTFYSSLTNGILSGGVKNSDNTTENTGRLSFVDTLTSGGSEEYVMQLKTDHKFLLNAERIYVGTNSGTVYLTENNRHTICLPYQINSDGRVAGWYTGITFINGMLPTLGG